MNTNKKDQPIEPRMSEGKETLLVLGCVYGFVYTTFFLTIGWSWFASGQMPSAAEFTIIMIACFFAGAIIALPIIEGMQKERRWQELEARQKAREAKSKAEMKAWRKRMGITDEEDSADVRD